VSGSETIDDRKRRESNEDAAIPTTTTSTTEKTLTPFQAQRVLLIGKLRELATNGHSPLAIQAELGTVKGNIIGCIRRRLSMTASL
jgi:hypothetical protein